MKTSIKKVMAIVLTITMLVGTAGVATSSGKWKQMKVYEDPTVKFFKNNEMANLSSNTMFINGSTYLPVRALAEMLGIGVRWSEQERTVYLTDGGSNANSTVATNAAEISSYIAKIASKDKEIARLEKKVKNLEDNEKKLKDEIADLKKRSTSTPYSSYWTGSTTKEERDIESRVGNYVSGNTSYRFGVKVKYDYNYNYNYNYPYDYNYGYNYDYNYGNIPSGSYYVDRAGTVRDWQNQANGYTTRDGKAYDYAGNYLGPIVSYNYGNGYYGYRYTKDSSGYIRDRYNNIVTGAYESNGIVYDKKGGTILGYLDTYYGGYGRDYLYNGYNEIEIYGTDTYLNYRNISVSSNDFKNYIGTVASAARSVLGSYPSRIRVTDVSGTIITYSISSSGTVN